ncbi:PAS domain S-box protein [Novispirillum sp. DQ9]|uniref:hybrid sensor histidine kinase/response regulator n=1 Tax=Novispirillum sp. DQ9 TaxID=3398612 RepID=UPI003C7AEC49
MRSDDGSSMAAAEDVASLPASQPDTQAGTQLDGGGLLPRIQPLRIIALAGLVLVVAATLALGTLARVQVGAALTTDAEHTAEALGSVLAPLLGGTSGATDGAIRRFRDAVAQVAAVKPVIEVTVADARGIAVFSTAPLAIGKPVDSPVGVQEALAGRVWAGPGEVRAYVLPGAAGAPDVASTPTAVLTVHVPLRAASAAISTSGGAVPGPVVGVAVVHQDMARISAAIDDAAVKLVAAAVAVMAVLYAGLLMLGRHIDLLVGAQQAQIAAEVAERREAEAHLRRVQDAMESTIAERTRRLRESEARFREFAESASDWLWETDESHAFTYVSEGFRRLIGADPQWYLGRSRLDMRADGQDAPARWQIHQDDLRNHRPFRAFSYSLRLPDGSSRFVSASGTPVFDERGRFKGYRGTGTDLTHQHEAEQTITRMGRIIDQSANEVYIFDAETLNFLQVNRGARQNLGHSAEDMAEMTPLSIMPLETADSFRRRLNPLRQRPSTSTVFESLYRRKDGSRYPVEVRLQYMAQERPPVFVAVVQDITARRQAELALQESEERFRAVAEMSLDGIIVDVDGVIVYANRQAVQITRANTIGDLITQPLERFVHTDHRAMLAARLRRMHTTGRATDRTEIRLLRLSGQPFDAEMSSSPITYAGQTATQTVLRDVTDTKVVQGQLIQTAKLATLGEMAAGMAHELSQPMNVIRMAAEGALLENADGSGPARDAKGALEIIASQAGRMGEIIEHMRIFSRKEPEAVEVFDPSLCIMQAVNMIESQLYAEGIAITARYPLGTHGVRGRPVHLEQVLLNLLTNARDAVLQRWRAEPPESSFRGTVSVEGAVSTADNRLIIRVTDNGGGIAADIMDRIFEPFYTTKEVGTGTGLGLSVSYSLVSGMNGALRVRNAEEGAQFEITLPIDREAPGESSGEAAAVPPPRFQVPPPLPLAGDDDEPSALLLHILVVDDEPFATKLVADHLDRLGYRVTTAGDGEEGYEKFLADPPDLVITDLRMPRCDGAEMIRRMQAHVPDLPVIVVTGHLGHLESAATDLKDHTAAILKKPISLAELTHKVRALVSLPAAAS